MDSMFDRTWFGAILGFILFCLGGVGYAYMDYTVHAGRTFSDFRRSIPINAYMGKMRRKETPAWPVYLAACIPLGIVVAFGSIFLSK